MMIQSEEAVFFLGPFDERFFHLSHHLLKLLVKLGEFATKLPILTVIGRERLDFLCVLPRDFPGCYFSLLAPGQARMRVSF